MASFYGDTDMTRVMYGENARHVPAWAYVQRQGPSAVGLAGASRVAHGVPHPLLYGTEWQHVFIVGEVIVRPHVAVGTNALGGYGLGSFFTHDHDPDEMLSDGKIIIGTEAMLADIYRRSGD